MKWSKKRRDFYLCLSRNEKFVDVIEDHFESRLGESDVSCVSYVRSAQYSYLTLTQFEIQTKTPVRHLQTWRTGKETQIKYLQGFIIK